MDQRIPDNLVGETLKAVRQNTDDFNKFMMTTGGYETNPTSPSANFPLTTN